MTTQTQQTQELTSTRFKILLLSHTSPWDVGNLYDFVKETIEKAFTEGFDAGVAAGIELAQETVGEWHRPQSR